MNAPALALAGNQASTSPACEAALSEGAAPAAASEPEDVAEEVVSPEQRKARRKRKRKEAESRLSFADELGDGEEEEEASPRASLGALTADRFEAEAKASRKRSSSSSSSSQRLLREAALSSGPLSPPPTAPARQWARDGADGSQLPAGQQPLLLHAVACAKGGRPYMEDRHVWVQDLGTLAPRLQGASYACVLDGHGGSRAADFAAAELHRRIAVDANPNP